MFLLEQTMAPNSSLLCLAHLSSFFSSLFFIIITTAMNPCWLLESSYFLCSLIIRIFWIITYCVSSLLIFIWFFIQLIQAYNHSNLLPVRIWLVPHGDVLSFCFGFFFSIFCFSFRFESLCIHCLFIWVSPSECRWIILWVNCTFSFTSVTCDWPSKISQLKWQNEFVRVSLKSLLSSTTFSLSLSHFSSSPNALVTIFWHLQLSRLFFSVFAIIV